MLCKRYTIPRVCLIEGEKRAFKFNYIRPDGTPINLSDATIEWTLRDAISRGILKQKTISKKIGENSVVVIMETQDTRGNLIQNITITLPTGEILIDEGMVLVYGD